MAAKPAMACTTDRSMRPISVLLQSYWWFADVPLTCQNVPAGFSVLQCANAKKDGQQGTTGEGKKKKNRRARRPGGWVLKWRSAVSNPGSQQASIRVQQAITRGTQPRTQVHRPGCDLEARGDAVHLSMNPGLLSQFMTSPCLHR
jgi:hypothetical protein